VARRGRPPLYPRPEPPKLDPPREAPELKLRQATAQIAEGFALLVEAGLEIIAAKEGKSAPVPHPPAPPASLPPSPERFEYITVREAAGIMRVSQRTIHRLAHEERALEFVRFGKQWRIRRDSVDKLVSHGGQTQTVRRDGHPHSLQ
jgi:excisionase family DNA binding protein